MWESVFAWSAVSAGLVAAVLWLQASWVSVDPGWRPGSGISEPLDPGAANADWIVALTNAAGRSGRLNAWAAGVTAVAVLLQALSLIAHRLGE